MGASRTHHDQKYISCIVARAMAFRFCKRRRVHKQTVTINVGGEKLIAVSPDLFDILGENQLSSQLSGHSEPLRDKDGNIVVDYSPEVFMPLVDWLRDVRDMQHAEPGIMSHVQVKDERRYSWIRMMRAFSVDVRYLVMAGVAFHELVCVGFSGTQLRSVFRLDCTLQLALGVSVAELQQAGFSEQDIQGAEAILRNHPHPFGNADYIYWQDPCLLGFRNTFCEVFIPEPWS